MVVAVGNDHILGCHLELSCSRLLWTLRRMDKGMLGNAIRQRVGAPGIGSTSSNPAPLLPQRRSFLAATAAAAPAVAAEWSHIPEALAALPVGHQQQQEQQQTVCNSPPTRKQSTQRSKSGQTEHLMRTVEDRSRWHMSQWYSPVLLSGAGRGGKGGEMGAGGQAEAGPRSGRQRHREARLCRRPLLALCARNHPTHAVATPIQLSARAHFLLSAFLPPAPPSSRSRRLFRLQSRESAAAFRALPARQHGVSQWPPACPIAGHAMCPLAVR